MKSSSRYFAGILILLLAGAARSVLAAPVLVADFLPGQKPGSLEPGSFATLGGRLYFAGEDPDHGEEPWVSDGTAAGTHRLFDLCPGPCSSQPGDFTALGEAVLFAAADLDEVFALQSGEVTSLLRYQGDFGKFVGLGELLYFDITAGNSQQIYRTDGSLAGTYLTSDFCGYPCEIGSSFEAVNGAIYFAWSRSLMRLDPSGQRERLGDLDDASQFTALDATRVVFEGCQPATGCRAWISDGTAAGTLLLDPSPTALAEGPLVLAASQGKVYFRGSNHHLIETDGTPAGTLAVPPTLGREVEILASTPGSLFYLDLGEPAVDRHLHALRGGQVQPVLALESYPSRIGQDGERIYLAHGGRILATSDGTVGGSRDLLETNRVGGTGAVLNGLFYFGFVPRNQTARILGRTNGSPAGTGELPLGLVEPLSSRSIPYRLGDGLLVQSLEASGSIAPLEWIDPVTLGRSILDPRPFRVEAATAEIAFASRIGLLLAIRPDGKTELPVPALLEAEVSADGHLFFAVNDPGIQLWESDGTAAGTRRLFQLPPEPPCPISFCGPHLPTGITPSGSNLVFFISKSSSPGHLFSLWVWDRLAATTRELRPLPGMLDLFPAPHGQVLFAEKESATSTTRLWISDGTVAGTRAFLTLPAGESWRLGLATIVGQRLVFTLEKDAAAWLFATEDFTEDGLDRLNDQPFAAIPSLTAAGERFFFRAATAATGLELGVSDGSGPGTRLLDLRPGPAGSAPGESFALADGRVVFAATADSAGLELWISNGSPATTFRLTDLQPGPAASAPDHFAQIGHRLFFQASDGVVGRELWTLDLDTAIPPCAADRLCLQNGHFDIEVVAHTREGDFAGTRVDGTADSAVFSFFSANNWEMLVKVLDGCAINQKFWVFAASATDAGFTLTVTDRTTGAPKIYRNSLGNPAVAITDTAAFSCN